MALSRIPTVEDICNDPLTKLAAENWSSSDQKNTKFDAKIVSSVYKTEIYGERLSRLQLLDYSGYLENYLWRHYSHPNATEDHILSIVIMVNEKFRANATSPFSFLTGGSVVEDAQLKFSLFFQKIVAFVEDASLSDNAMYYCLKFFTNAYRSLENGVVRISALKYLSLPLWTNLSTTRLERELTKYPQLQRHWEHFSASISRAIASASEAVPKAATSASSNSKKRSRRGSKDREQTEEPSPAPLAALNANQTPESTFIPGLLQKFLGVVESPQIDGDIDPGSRRTAVVFLEFISDLLSQIPTRRFLHVLLDDFHFIPRCRRCSLNVQGSIFAQFVDVLDEFARWNVDNQTGRALAPHESAALRLERVHNLQKIAFTHFNDSLRDLVFSSSGELMKADTLKKHLIILDDGQLIDLARKSGHLSEPRTEKEAALFSQASFAMDLIVNDLCAGGNRLDELNRLSLYPTESLLWDFNLLPRSAISDSIDQPLSLPKLNVQFLTMHDYLLRNFTLYRMESAYGVRGDLADAIVRAAPRLTGRSSATVFAGFARTAVPTISVSIDEVAKPTLGETIPHHVTCTVEIDISRFTGDVRMEWEALREHDVVFLVAIANPQLEGLVGLDQFESDKKSLAVGQKSRPQSDILWQEVDEHFADKYGVKYVRGAEIFEVKDEANVVLNDYSRPDERPKGRAGTRRKLRMRLDPAQYYADVTDGRSCYDSINLLVRRKPETNNFKAVLESVRDLMNSNESELSIPAWLREILLGYGDVSSASFRSITKLEGEQWDAVDTFLDAAHIHESFPHARVGVDSSSLASGIPPPLYRLSIAQAPPGPTPAATVDTTAAAAVDDEEEIAPDIKKRRASRSKAAPKKVVAATTGPSTASSIATQSTESKESKEAAVAEIVTVVPYKAASRGPYPEDAPPRNSSIRYTPKQIEAIRSGVNPGLSLIIGPPGTGKTDVAVQIIVALYHNFPTQKILLVTHSNAALNDLFEKIMQRDIEGRHLLRLGSGERDLRETLAGAGAGGLGRGQGQDFSKQGRVNWCLNRRLQLLSRVSRLAQTLGVVGDVGYSCETAAYFYAETVLPLLKSVEAAIVVQEPAPARSVQELFPFTAYFADTPKPLFTGDAIGDRESAGEALVHVRSLFSELGEYRAFEVLRTQSHRADYLLTKQARIVAMTCTHAALTRRRLLELGFKYDSVVMEESGQIMEVEALIPLLLQRNDVVDGCRLKRLVMIGDHFQLPPVVQHLVLQRACHLDQSMFARLLRLGVSSVLLDKQGRARPEIAELYSWRYSGLGHLHSVLSAPEYATANVGFLHPFQLINVPAFQGKGESSPSPHVYQNLGEAEYVVAVYQYMRLIGYPAEKISILTTYNGQKQLVREILSKRCRGSIFGMPGSVSTVDKYQGQQNDFVLLSLVRTASVGHMRDVRRLVVALSRARLGLYVFCRQELFESCYELSPAFAQLARFPNKLLLVAGEARSQHSHPEAEAAQGTSRSKERAVHESPEDASSVCAIEDVTAMGILVYQMLQLSQQQQQQQPQQAVDLVRNE